MRNWNKGKKLLAICLALAVCYAACLAALGNSDNLYFSAVAETIITTVTEHISYTDGSTYNGNVLYGKIRNGTGTFTWSTGEVYEGTWENDVQSGTGKMTWPGFGIYEGEFQNGKRDGYGTFTWTYDDIVSPGQPLTFRGEWKDDKIGDSGVMEFSELGIYEGEFSKSVRSGKGTFTWSNGDQYVGMWQNDKINGDGVLTLADGTILEGQFANNVLNRGTATYAVDGGIATRSVQYGKLQQSVTIVYENGTAVSGKLSGDTFTGNVTIYYPSGDKYVGTMSNGLKSGKGTYTWVSGAHYIGDWENDKMSGTGKYYYGQSENNTYLSGTFADGKPSGTLIYVSEKKLQYNTVWSNGTCTSITYKKK